MADHPTFIALIGAPGSGKTVLANEIAKQLDGPVTVVDGYVQKTQKEMDLALGGYATYFGNLAVALNRVGAEREAIKGKPDYVITCGTHIETIVYSSISAYFEQRENPEANDLHLERTSIFMRFLGMLSNDTFGYAHVFLLPLPDPKDEFAKRVHEEILMAVDTFGVEYTRLDEDPDKQIEKALSEIREGDNEAEVSEGQ
jgi:nicotinamide riboside kinase